MSPVDQPSGRERAGAARPPAGGASGQADDAVLAVVKRFDRAERDIRDLRGQVVKLANLIGRGKDDDERPPVPCWLLVEDPGEATATLDELAGWLTEVYLRFTDARLPVCWAWHVDAVYELTSLRDLWAEAHHGDRRSPAAVGEWLRVARPGVVQRLSRLERCDLEQHLGERPAHRPRTAPLRSVLPVIAGMWAVSRDLPVPTDEHKQDALRHSNLILADLDDQPPAPL